MNVFDSSALLAFLQGERGADDVETALLGGPAVCSAVTWSEVAQKVHQHGGDWGAARGLLLSYGLQVEPAAAEDAERAAGTWSAGDGLSLADRFCLATGERLDAVVWTADRAWGRPDRVRQVR